MNIRFYKNFSKRKNSTKRPSASDNYNDRACYLKEDTSIDNPSIVLSNREGNMSQAGNPITTSNAIASNANSCSVSFTPTQAYNGYNKPWAPGAGVNIWDEQWEVGSISGTTGANTGGDDRLRSINYISVIPGETYYFHSQITVSGYFFLRLYDSNEAYISNVSVNVDSTYTIPLNVAYIRFTFVAATAGTYYHDICINISDPSINGNYYPYANICTINGKTSINLNVNGITITEPFGQTVYGGVWNIISGTVRDDWDVIASYNGESLPGEWLSTMDLYSSINPPTTGAEVVYKVTTPTSFTIPGHVVSLNENVNTLSANADSISINYDISNSGDLPLNYTYAYIDHFKKYYFVSPPVILTDGTIQYDLVEDVLATNKTAVGATKAQIVYSSTGYNKHIVDTRMSVKANKAYFNRQTQSSGFNSTGCYIVGVINDESSGKYGAASYYLMTQSQLKDLIECLSSTDINAQIQQYFSGDWMQFIVSCIWIPVSYSDALSWFTGGLATTTRIKVGSTGLLNSQAIEAKGTPLTSTLHDFTSVSLSIPYKWQDFRDCEPYTSASLYLVGLGDTDININDFYSSTNVSIQYRIDAVTGDITYRIYNDDGTVVKTVMFNGGVNVVLSNTAIQTGGVLTAVGGLGAGAVGIGLSAVTGNIAGVIGSGIAAMGAGASILTSANHRSTSIKGTNQGRSSFADTSFILTICSLDTENIDASDYIARWGRPVGEVGTISSYSGYVQCEGASVAIAGDEWERDEINSYLNSGFYYE